MRERGEIFSQLVEWSEVGGSVMYKVLNLGVGEDKSHFLTEILQLFSSVFFFQISDPLISQLPKYIFSVKKMGKSQFLFSPSSPSLGTGVPRIIQPQ